jgi:predicted nuclease of predicted toxin-antitoxin system
MRWLLDQGLPRGAVQILREAGQDAVHIGDLGRATASDAEILHLGEAENRIVVTFDADFHMLLAASAATRPSVIRIREEGMKAGDVATLLLAILAEYAEPLAEGCVMVFARGVIRLRHLPIVP